MAFSGNFTFRWQCGQIIEYWSLLIVFSSRFAPHENGYAFYDGQFALIVQPPLPHTIPSIQPSISAVFISCSFSGGWK